MALKSKPTAKVQTKAEEAKKAEVKAEVKPVEVKAEQMELDVAAEPKTVAEKVVEKAEEAKKAVEEKKETAVKKAAGVKKAAAAKKTTAAKKETVSKAAEKKAVEKKETVKASVHVQSNGNSYEVEDLVKITKDIWKYDFKKKATEFKSVDIYVKLEDKTAYYVINGEITGSFPLN